MKINHFKPLIFVSGGLIFLSSCSSNTLSESGEEQDNESTSTIASDISLADEENISEHSVNQYSSPSNQLPARRQQIAWDRTTAQNQSAPKNPSNLSMSGEWGALAFLSEIAPRNYRGSATYGNYLAEKHRFKLSGEYLVQKIGFDFESSDRKKWISQLAFGGEYQYLIQSSVFQSLEFGTAYVHSFHHELKWKSLLLGPAERRIAGANGSLSFIGTTLRLWNCAFLSAALDYDWVHFNRIFQNDKNSNGFGGSVGFVQRFAKDFSLNLDAEFRQPYNSYRGLLNWNHAFSSWNLDIGIFGNLTRGHDHIRNIGTVGIQVGITSGTKPKTCSWTTEMPSHQRNCYNREFCDIGQWVSTPAVYVPIVLAIADEKLPTCDGKAPTSTNPGNFSAGIINPIEIPPVYISSSLPVTYSMSQSSQPLPGNTLDFDPTTGVISASGIGGNRQVITVTVTATNTCGSTSQTFRISYPSF
jgi:hypothetical protein